MRFIFKILLKRTFTLGNMLIFATFEAFFCSLYLVKGKCHTSLSKEFDRGLVQPAGDQPPLAEPEFRK